MNANGNILRLGGAGVGATEAETRVWLTAGLVDEESKDLQFHLMTLAKTDEGEEIAIRVNLSESKLSELLSSLASSAENLTRAIRADT
jgi:hypothetical protein